MSHELKAPFPWFGGKSRVAEMIWQRLGDVNNYIEPFAGSLAVLLRRPHPPRVETLNDLDCYVANFWRATQHDPEAVAMHADWPLNETDLHARHRWLVLSDAAGDFRRRMREDPDYYEPRFAGWWCWGLCGWIGGGWCTVPGETDEEIGCEQERRPQIGTVESRGGVGVHRVARKIPKLSGDTSKSEGSAGVGVHAQPQRRPILAGDNPGCVGTGIHAGGRPQLADAYARGRGIHGNDAAETCANRRAWLLDWFQRLRDRLRVVRVCCGDWSRVCNSDSVTVRLGTTGVFLDPPYGKAAGRDPGLYSTDSLAVAEEVRRWCVEWGSRPQLRIALCGYVGEGHEELEKAGWTVVPWKAHGGYGNRSAVGKANAAKERIWFSPHCNRQSWLFDLLPQTGEPS